jgi:hypothetical protein
MRDAWPSSIEGGGLHDHGHFESIFAIALGSRSALTEALHKNSRDSKDTLVEDISKKL